MLETSGIWPAHWFKQRPGHNLAKVRLPSCQQGQMQQLERSACSRHGFRARGRRSQRMCLGRFCGDSVVIHLGSNHQFQIPSGKHTKSYGIDGPFVDGLPFLKMVIFYNYLSLPEGNFRHMTCGIWTTEIRISDFFWDFWSNGSYLRAWSTITGLRISNCFGLVHRLRDLDFCEHLNFWSSECSTWN